MQAPKHSIRLRLVAAAAVTIAIALAVAGTGLHFLFERHVERRTVAELDTDLRQLMSGLVVAEDGSIELERLPGDQRYSQPFSGAYWQVVRGSGGIVARSRSLWDEELVLPADELPAGDFHMHAIYGPLEQQLLIVERKIVVNRPNKALTFRFSAALDRSESAAAVSAFGKDLAVALTLLGACLLAAFGAAVGVGLNPLAQLQSALGRLRAGDDVRLTGEFPREVEPLIDDLNTLLEQRDRSIASARARATDLAHGLKTPITAISVIAEELGAQGNPATADELLGYVRSMQGHVERELVRARSAEAGTFAPPVPLMSIVDALVNSMRRLPRGSQIKWEVDVPLEILVKSHKSALAEVLGNLLDNARKWTHSKVIVRAALGDDSLIIEVADDGPGIPQSEVGTVLARGGRLDESVPGSGFGLAIAAEYVDQIGARMDLLEAGGGGLCVRITVPSLR